MKKNEKTNKQKASFLTLPRWAYIGSFLLSIMFLGRLVRTVTLALIGTKL